MAEIDKMTVDIRIEEITDLEKRVTALERLVACPRCRGAGHVETSLGPDECPECHGSKINRVFGY